MVKHAVTIHDAFFKQIIGDPTMADRFLREHLPPEVVALLGGGLPELLPGSFVDEELGQHHSDLLFRIGLRSGGEALVHLVIEHKSAPDLLARLQLLRYILRILVQWVRARRKARLPILPLPPVVPLLVHHGPAGWTVSRDFVDLFGPVPDALRPFLPSFRHGLVDLIHIPDHALSADARLRMRLKALKYALRPDVARLLDVILAEAATLDDVDVAVVLAYIVRVPAGVGEEAIRAALGRVAPSRAEELMTTWLQTYVDQGVAKGFQQGRAEGKAEGKADMLLRLLHRRFGPLTTEVETRVRAADSDQLDEWSERFVDAGTLADVFDAAPH